MSYSQRFTFFRRRIQVSSVAGVFYETVYYVNAYRIAYLCFEIQYFGRCIFAP